MKTVDILVTVTYDDSDETTDADLLSLTRDASDAFWRHPAVTYVWARSITGLRH